MTDAVEVPVLERKKAEKPKFGSLAEAGLETFVVESVKRGQLVNAPYNPRTIRPQEQAKLKKALKKHGLVAPITWNKRTGHIVGGHQRISIMDSLMRSDDYELQVAVIDVDEPREKELNVLLNNTSAMGQWDMEGLQALFKDESVKLDGAGFDMTDMIDLFGSSSLNDRSEDLAALATKLGQLSSQYTAIQKKNKEKSSAEFFLVFVFPDGDHVDKLIAEMSWKDARYQSGVELMDLLNVSPPGDEDPDEEPSAAAGRGVQDARTSAALGGGSAG